MTKQRRVFLLMAACLTAFFGARTALAQAPGAGLITHATATRHGMRRMWASQVELDRTRDRVNAMVLDVLDEPDPTGAVRDAVFVQTDRGVLHALDSETGRTLWIVNVGPNRENPTMAPAANDKFVAVVNGSTLYVLKRSDGQIAWEKTLRRVPTSPPALGKDMVYVPSITGHITAYVLDDPTAEPVQYEGNGMIDIAPLAGQFSVAWATERGFLYLATPALSEVRFRFETRDAITAPLGYWPPYVLLASRDGYIYAVDEATGATPWRFSTGYPINKQPVAVSGAVYVVSETGGIHCLSAESGAERWSNVRARGFAAVSEDRVYAVDTLGRLLVLDAATGGLLDLIPTTNLPLKMVNTQTDRIYAASKTGLVVCLAEQGRRTPLVHQLPKINLEKAPLTGEAPAAEDAPAAEVEDAADPFTAEGAEEEAPAEEEEEPADAGADPFGGDAGADDEEAAMEEEGEDAAMEEEAADENPFD